ncbi:related to toxD gene [Phialocephala subalpina]|uniref:Related to toxD protein n=1 Tax=Phialocephala subalpina TaxID=576137 RepID=A0A1L7X007_9HELO|nr:related to toxD gene [Phialocephala subalpina]
MAVPGPQLPTHQTVIRQQQDCTLGISKNVPLPSLQEPNTILIKTHAVPLNPCDWKMPARFPCPLATDGCDFAGTIVQLSPGITRPLKIGDRVVGAVHGSNPARKEDGAFAEYVVTCADFVFVVPESWEWEKAAAFGGIGIATVGVGLWAGLIPIATCSRRSSEMVKSFGAEEVFDYNDPNCAADIRAYTKNSLKYVLDCIATSSTIKLCYAAIGRLGGKYTALEMPPLAAGLRQNIKLDRILGMMVLGKEIELSEGYHRPADPECHAFGLKWYKLVQELIDEGKLRPHPYKVMDGGFEGILEGLDLLREGKNQGTKLVYFL